MLPGKSIKIANKREREKDSRLSRQKTESTNQRKKTKEKTKEKTKVK